MPVYWYYVVDNLFNRQYYPDLIGRTFDDQPGYADVVIVPQE